MSNVLLTCAGRRNYLVDYFRSALGRTGKVFGADSRCDAPVLQKVDKAFQVPAIDHPSYCEQLLELCAKHQVSLLVPLNDLELPLLAREQERFADVGTKVLVSDPAVIETCFDKWATSLFLARHEIPAPLTYLRPQTAREALEQRLIDFPVVLKPRWGSASIGVELAHDLRELELGYELAKRRLSRTILASVSATEDCVLIQEYLRGEEMGMDVVNDLSGRHVSTLAKVKLGMRAGETDRARTVKSAEISALGAALGRCLGHVGILDCDLFATLGSLRVLEMNPRFGGGYPFSHAAGANVPAALLEWQRGNEVPEEWLQVVPGVTAAKCDGLVVFE